MTVQPFKIASISLNANSFGLRGVIIVARNGDMWEFGANYFRVKEFEQKLSSGEAVFINTDNFAELGVEIPRKAGKLPASELRKFWTDGEQTLVPPLSFILFPDRANDHEIRVVVDNQSDHKCLSDYDGLADLIYQTDIGNFVRRQDINEFVAVASGYGRVINILAY